MNIHITVLKTHVFGDLQDFCDTEIQSCPSFHEGQEFDTTYEKPEGFCDWAWRDLHPYLAALNAGGNFATGAYANWMKDPNTMVACCTGGLRLTVFKLERQET